MARNLRELWRISAGVYREAAFQSVYVLRRGGQLGEMSWKDIEQSMKVGMWATKGMLAFVLIFTAAGATLGNVTTKPPAGVQEAFSMGIYASTFIFAALFIISVMALDMVTGFISSKVLQAMVPLPLERQDLAKVSLLAFVRIFDLPIVVGALAFPIMHFILTRSLAGSLLYFVAIAVTECLGVVLSVALAEVFYTRVLNQTGSGIKSLTRVFYMILWAMPGLAMFLIFNFQASAGRAVLNAIAANPRLPTILSLVYPFPFGFLITAVTGVPGVGGTLLVISTISSLFYTGLAAWGILWAAARIRARGLGGAIAATGPRTAARHFRIRLVAPWLAILLKDLRIIFRSPSEANLFLMPAVATIPWAIATGMRTTSPQVASGLVTSIAFLALMVMPALFSVEVVGHAYVRTLPVRRVWFLEAKAGVATVTYIVSMLIMVAVAALMRRIGVGLVLAFGVSEAFSAAAAALAIGAILMGRMGPYARRISPSTSLSTHILIFVAGGIIVALPTAAAIIGSPLTGLFGLPAHFAVGILEMLIAVALVYCISHRGA